jgi:hypothetical protein
MCLCTLFVCAVETATCWIGNLPGDVTEVGLKDALKGNVSLWQCAHGAVFMTRCVAFPIPFTARFTDIGKIVNVRLPINRKKSETFVMYAHVEFASVAEAAAAVALDGTSILDKVVTTRFSEPYKAVSDRGESMSPFSLLSLV